MGKRILRTVLHVLEAFVAFIVLYLLAAFGLPHIAVAAEEQGAPTVDIYILSNGVHTDIVVPVVNAWTDWRTDVPYGNTTGKDSTARWLAMGWGDRGFYLETPTWGDLTARVACRAVFGLGSTAMHATFHDRMTENADCKRIPLDRAHYERLCAYIRASFTRNDARHSLLIPTKAVYGTTDAFYEGTGSYSLFHTCNTWANDALKAGGQRACLWTPFSAAIFDRYEEAD